MLIYTGRTVHVVPGEGGAWNVVDLQRHGWSFPTKAAALEYAKHVAVANQPSQVVVFDAFGRMEPIAHYQLPTYPAPQAQSPGGASMFEATVKALLIGGFAAAGIAVLGDLVDRVERDVRRNRPDRERRRSRPVALERPEAADMTGNRKKRVVPLAVFINCPFDPSYRKIFDAIVFVVCALGFEPHCALDRDDGTKERLTKILHLIEERPFGIHDLPYMKVDPGTRLPRHKMPFELGLFLGYEFARREGSNKSCLILDRDKGATESPFRI